MRSSWNPSEELATLVVHPENSLQGGRFFTVRTRACLSGRNFGGRCLKLGWVGVGLRMEFHTEDTWVITSHVRSIAVEQSATRQLFWLLTAIRQLGAGKTCDEEI